MDTAELTNRFSYHPPKNEGTVERHELVRDIACHAALGYNALVPEGREKDLAITKLEEAMYWANAAVARNAVAE